MIPFSAILTPSSVAFTGLDGKPHNITSSHVKFFEIRELVKQIKPDTDTDTIINLREQIETLASPAKAIDDAGKGRVFVRDGVVFFKDEPINNAVTDRILWGLSEGFGMESYIAFLDNLMDNPSRAAVGELYGFIEKHKMGISDDGYIIAYKKVRDDYHDIHTGKFDNSPGQAHEMPRNAVDDCRDRTCSDGFHFCAFDYLSCFGSGPGNRVVIVKVNPRDVVSIPSDYNDAKARCCYYEVIGEYQGDDLQNILGTCPVWSPTLLLEHSLVDQEYVEDAEDEEFFDDDDEDFDDEEDGDSETCGNSCGSCDCGGQGHDEKDALHHTNTTDASIADALASVTGVLLRIGQALGGRKE